MRGTRGSAGSALYARAIRQAQAGSGVPTDLLVREAHTVQSLFAACLLERLPVVAPEDPYWERDYHAWHKELTQRYHKDLPAAFQTHDVTGNAENVEWQLDARAPGVAESTEVKSLKRALARRVFLVLHETGEPTFDAHSSMTSSTTGWRLPSTSYRAGETMRQAAERTLAEAVTGAPPYKIFFVGNAPCAHWESADGKTFIHKAQLIKGDVSPVLGSRYDDYAWLTREELLSSLGDAGLMSLFRDLLPKV